MPSAFEENFTESGFAYLLEQHGERVFYRRAGRGDESGWEALEAVVSRDETPDGLEVESGPVSLSVQIDKTIIDEVVEGVDIVRIEGRHAGEYRVQEIVDEVGDVWRISLA